MATASRKNTLSGQEEVARFLQELQHPMKEEIEEVRRIILNANSTITEHIKWNAPSFCCDGEDRITFNLQGKGFFRLIFHLGAKAKADKEKRLIDDPSGWLEWAANDRAILRISHMEDIESKRVLLTDLVNKWVGAGGSQPAVSQHKQ